MYLDKITDEYFALPATKRHHRILSAIEKNLDEFAYDDRFFLSREAASLVHYGSDKNRSRYSEMSLVDLDEVEDTEKFRKMVMNDLYWVEPDIVLFTTNRFIENETETRVAGFPNLVIEVWSTSNTLFDRQKKFDIYRTGASTEHWYIEQDSNIVRCFMGNTRLDDKNIKDVLCTSGGICIDIRRLALAE